MDPFTGPDNRKAFEWLVRNIDQSSRLLRSWDLKGGVSAQVAALEIERPDGTTERVVVRRHGGAHLQSNPNAAADEFRLLEVLHAAGLPVPAPIYVDRSGKSVASPCVVIAYIDGASEFAPANLPTFVRHLATILASIHAVDVSTVSFLSEQSEWTAAEFHARLPGLANGGDSTGIEQAIASTAAHVKNRPVLLHGDFWPGNVLWKDGHLAAIIDWEDARLGDPLSDISGARLELLWAFGTEAMEQFTEDYMSLTDTDPTRLPYWDLRVAIGPAAAYATWTDDAVTVQRMRERRHWFIAQALDNLAIRPAGQVAGSITPGRRLTMRPLKVGVQLPEVEYEYTWPQLAEMARIAEEIGLDSIWLGDHLMYRYPDPGQPPRGPFEAWTTLSALASVTSRVELGPLVASTGFHNPAMIAKMAATIDQISGGRFILGLGSGWHEPEYRGFGFPYDQRVRRFEEAFTIIRTLLRTGECTFHGEFHNLDGALLFPRSPRPDGPPIMLGSKGPRMLAIALPHVQMWNAWWADYGNTIDGLMTLLGQIDAACDKTGRDPGTLIRTICPLVGMGGTHGRSSAGRTADHIIDGRDPAFLAGELAQYAELGVGHVQLVLDPITPQSIASLAPVLELLDA